MQENDLAKSIDFSVSSKKTNNIRKRNIFLAVWIFIIVAVAVIIGFRYLNLSVDKNVAVPELEGLTNVKKLSDKSLPPAFPEDFPDYGLVGNPVNLAADSTNNRVFSQRQFVSNLSPQEIYSNYREYFVSSKNWPIFTKSSQSETKIEAYGANDRTSATFSIIDQSKDGKTESLVTVYMFSDPVN